MDPLLSIIIPTMNRRNLLEEVIGSILVPNSSLSLEIIIADDGSSDGTPEYCSELQNVHGSERVVISRTQQNQGAQVARNRGMEIARGKYIQFVDSDDLCVLNGIETLIAVLEKDPDLDYAYGKVIQVDSNLVPLHRNAVVGKEFSNESYEIAGYHWHTMGAVYRKVFLTRVGPWSIGLTGSQDWEYQARVKITRGKRKFLDTVVGYWRHHGESRVGATKFRPDYVNSVMLACAAVISSARLAGLCDEELEYRVAKKLLIHAMEWGANGYRDEAVLCFQLAMFSLSKKSPIKFLFGLAQKMPLVVYRYAWRFYIRIKDARSGDAGGFGEGVIDGNRLAQPMLVTIMITTKNRSADLRKTCRVISQLDPPPYEILMTADGCTDDTVDVIKSELPQAKILINSSSLGSVGSRAKMMRLAQGDIVLSLDDDSYPMERHFLAHLPRYFQENPFLAVATFPQRSDEYPETLQQENFGSEKSVRTFANSGACFRVLSYRSLYGFVPFFQHMYEEPDYGLQCVANGWEIRYFPEITIRHHYSGVERSELKTHHRHARNEFWSVLMRCPFPYCVIIILYRIFSQARYASQRGVSWLLKEPLWWFDALRKVPVVMKQRHPVKWSGYRRWLSLP